MTEQKKERLDWTDSMQAGKGNWFKQVELSKEKRFKKKLRE